MKVFDRLLTPEGDALRKLVDPYEYRQRYTMPKFLVNSTGDQFFLPDSAQFYYDDLPGPKYLRYIPNTDHGLDFSAAASLLLFYKSILTDSELPKFTWKVVGDWIRIRPISGNLKKVNLWQASNEKARDFRVDTIGRVWKSSPLKPLNIGRYVARVPVPTKGWTAFFAEMVYDSGGPVPHKFTTQVHVVPQRLPFADEYKSESIVDEGKKKDKAKKSKIIYKWIAEKKKVKEEKVLYAELTPHEFRERIAAAPIAYLPLGTLEWHGEHLPIGSDGLQSYGFFIELAREVGGIVLPMLFLGPDRMQKVDGKELYGMDICKGMPEDRRYPNQQLAGSAYWVPEETFRAIIEATLKQLSRAGFKIVVGHGHGPSTGFFQKHAKEWKEKYGLETFTCWGSEYDRQGLGIMVDHAAMNETSLVMALRPELVQMERLPKIDKGWPVGVGGKDPRVHASARVGRKAIKLQIKRMAKILRDALKN